MSKVRYKEDAIGAAERLVLNLAILSIEKVAQQEIVALVFADGERLAVNFRPGMERSVALKMAAVNWDAAALVVEEHIP